MTKPDPEVLKLLVAVSLLASCVSASSISSNSHIRDIEVRLRANVDDFKGRIFYHPKYGKRPRVRKTDGGSFMPYISFSPEDNTRTMFGLLTTKSSDWLMLNGAVVLVGGTRYTYSPDFFELNNLKGSDVQMSGYSTICEEWIHIPAKSRAPEFAMFRAIARAPNTVEVRIRASGSEHYKDWTLAESERQAWTDLIYYYEHFSERSTDLSVLGKKVDVVKKAMSIEDGGPLAAYKSVEVKPEPLFVPEPEATGPAEGEVVVNALVDTFGVVMKAIVKESSGEAKLDSAALDAALGAYFKPAKHHGKKVKVWLPLWFEFKHSGDDSKPDEGD